MKQPLLTYAEYLERERASETKHEYLRGDVWAMAGGTPEHGQLAMTLGWLLRTALEGRPCVIYSSDVRVRVVETDRTTYPDLSIVCGPDVRAPDDRHAIVNPVVVVEVLSEATEQSDRGEKFAHLQHLPSLQEYVLVAQSPPRVEVFRRQPRGWLLTIHEAGDTCRLESIDAAFSVDRLYTDPRTGRSG